MAGTSGILIRIVSNRLPTMPAAIRAAVGQAVKMTTRDIEARAKGLVPVRTGTLRRSITSQFPSELTGRVGPSVEYGLYVEMGSRKRAGRPYMRPAAEQASSGFVSAVRAALKGL